MNTERDFCLNFIKTWWWSLLPWCLFLTFADENQPLVGILLLVMQTLFWVWKLVSRVIPPSRFSILLFFCLSRGASFCTSPFYEDDYYRYIWDGLVTLHGGNALIISPEEVMVELKQHSRSNQALQKNISSRQQSIFWRTQLIPNLKLKELLEHINHPQSPSIYGPIAQVFCGMTSIPMYFLQKLLPNFSLPLSWRIQTFRGCLCFIEILLCWVIYHWTAKNLSFLALLMTCPLLLKEVSNSLHLDILSVFLGFVAFTNLKNAKMTRSCVFLALCTGIKPYAFVLWPLMALYKKRMSFLYLSSALIFLIYLPWILSGGNEIWAGTRYFSLSWSMNDFYTALWRELFYHGFNCEPRDYDLAPIGIVIVSGAQFYARSLGFLTFLLYFLVIFKTFYLGEKNIKDVLSVVASILLAMWWCSPVLNPWYLLWGLPYFLITRHSLGLFFVACSPLYLFNFSNSASSHLLHSDFQWWVVLPHVGALLIFAYFRWFPKSRIDIWKNSSLNLISLEKFT